MQLALTSGRGPDMFAAGIPQFVRWNRAGFLRPLDDIAEAAGWKDKFQPWALDLGNVDGKLLWVPGQVETMIVFYSPTVFEQNGWSYPTTFADFEAVCRDAEDRGMTPIAAGNADWQAASEWHLGFHLNHGAGAEAVYQGLTGELRWTDDVFVDALTRLNDYMQRGWYGNGPQRYFTTKFDAMYRDLAEGKAAFIYTGSWGLAEIMPFFGSEAGNDAEWDWQISPPLSSAGPTDVYQLSVGETVGINSMTSAPDLAGAFLDLLADQHRAGRSRPGRGGAPARPRQDEPERLRPVDGPAHRSCLRGDRQRRHGRLHDLDVLARRHQHVHGERDRQGLRKQAEPHGLPLGTRRPLPEGAVRRRDAAGAEADRVTAVTDHPSGIPPGQAAADRDALVRALRRRKRHRRRRVLLGLAVLVPAGRRERGGDPLAEHPVGGLLLHGLGRPERPAVHRGGQLHPHVARPRVSERAAAQHLLGRVLPRGAHDDGSARRLPALTCLPLPDPLSHRLLHPLHGGQHHHRVHLGRPGGSTRGSVATSGSTSSATSSGHFPRSPSSTTGHGGASSS